MSLSNEQCTEFMEMLRGCMEYSRKYYGRSIGVESKRDGTAVTPVDVHLEKTIFATLRKIMPDAGFIGEETDNETTLEESQKNAQQVFQKEYVWVVDPLDGTSNFAAGYGEWAISIGLLKKETHGLIPVFGVIALPTSGLVYLAHEGKVKTYQDVGTLQEIPYLGQPLFNVAKDKLPSKPMFSINGSRVAHYAYASGIALRVPGCTVTQISGVALGAAIGTVIAEHIWDFVGAMAIGYANGCKMYEVATTKEVAGLTLDMFDFSSNKQNWRLKQHYWYFHPNLKETVLEKVKPQKR